MADNSNIGLILLFEKKTTGIYLCVAFGFEDIILWSFQAFGYFLFPNNYLFTDPQSSWNYLCYYREIVFQDGRMV